MYPGVLPAYPRVLPVYPGVQEYIICVPRSTRINYLCTLEYYLWTLEYKKILPVYPRVQEYITCVPWSTRIYYLCTLECKHIRGDWVKPSWDPCAELAEELGLQMNERMQCEVKPEIKYTKLS